MSKKYKGQEGRKDAVMFRPEALKVITDKKHRLYDPRIELPLDEGMVQSILCYGIIQPIIIYPDGDDVYVSAGRQRRAAAIEANRRLVKEGKKPILVPCVWRKGDEPTLFAISQVENNIRRGDSPIDRAKNMQRIIDMGGNEKDVSIAFGCTVATVKNTLALLDCDAKVQRAVSAGQVSAIVATKLSKLPREEQRGRLDKMVEEGATRGSRAKEMVEKGEVGEKSPKMLSRKNVEKLRDAVIEHVGASDGFVAILSFVLGDDHALVRFDGLSAAAEAAFGGKKSEKVEKAPASAEAGA